MPAQQVGQRAAEQDSGAPPPERTKPIIPIAFARSAGSVNRIMISESAIAETIAPPRPWTARATMRNVCEFASPQSERRDRELGDPEEEHPLLAVEVAEASGKQQEAAERQQVGVHDPGKGRLREAEIVADRRQGDVHDRRVEHDHEIGQAEDVERQPALAVGEICHVR